MSTTFSPELLAQWALGRWSKMPARSIQGFGADTRTLAAGDAFVAIKTERRDGHNYLREARDRGATCALVSHAVADELPQLVVDDSQSGLQRIAAGWRQQFKGTVIGVTGSVGKTSTKDLLGALLGPSAFITEANLNNLLGVPLMLLRLDNAKHRFAVIEAGMSVPGELNISAQVIRPNLAIVTAVAPVHLAGVESLAGVAREKSALVAATLSGGKAIMPASLLAWPDFKPFADRTYAVQFDGEAAPAIKPARLILASLQSKGTHRILNVDGEAYALAALSDGLARNAALAIVAAKEAGISVDAIRQALEGWLPPMGRGSVHTFADKNFYIDCYNSSPASLLDAAQCFHRLSMNDSRPRLFVIGGMAELGTQSSHLHHECGANLPLRAGDTVIGWSGDVADLLQGIRVADVLKVLASSQAEVTAAIARHSGYIFIKGSRSCALERTLPADLQTQITFH